MECVLRLVRYSETLNVTESLEEKAKLSPLFPVRPTVGQQILDLLIRVRLLAWEPPRAPLLRWLSEARATIVASMPCAMPGLARSVGCTRHPVA